MQSENQPKGAGSGEPAAPATGRECWVVWIDGKALLVTSERPHPESIHTWVRMVEPPPSSPAREDVEPSGTASLRGAARLEEPEEDEHDIAFRKMKEQIRDTAPERIYLNVGPTDSFDEGTDFQADEVTWCKDEIDSFDVPYIRADLVPASEARSALPSSAGPSLSPSSPPSSASQGAETRKCDICTLPLTGLMIGNGDGAGQRFAHPACWAVARLKEAEAKVETLEAALKGAEERAKMVLDAKNHWANRAREAESALRAVERAPEAPAPAAPPAGVGASKSMEPIIAAFEKVRHIMPTDSIQVAKSAFALGFAAGEKRAATPALPAGAPDLEAALDEMGATIEDMLVSDCHSTRSRAQDAAGGIMDLVRELVRRLRSPGGAAHG